MLLFIMAQYNIRVQGSIVSSLFIYGDLRFSLLLMQVEIGCQRSDKWSANFLRAHSAVMSI